MVVNRLSILITVVVACLANSAQFTSVANGWQQIDIDQDPNRPFRQRFDVPDLPKDLTWLNTSGDIRFRDLQGKFVLMDFWTYCCINCMHIIPTLDKVEKKYADELLVIGVHSAKFDTEKDDKNITEAILRYEIKHPVINDHDHRLWDALSVRSWPTLLLLDPQGKVVWGHQGEIRHDELDAVLKRFVDYYDSKNLIDRTPIHIEIQANRQQDTPLRFPGKVLCDAENDRLFIADSNHNRIVVTDLLGKLIEIIGSSEVGRRDGDFATAGFDHPQGMTIWHNQL
jgi:thiol-disulfide isomerase/thioredoxin